jgi:hypothetical protein
MEEKVFAFTVSADLKTARVDIDTVTIQPTVKWTSFGLSEYPDDNTWLSRTASTYSSRICTARS